MKKLLTTIFILYSLVSFSQKIPVCGTIQTEPDQLEGITFKTDGDPVYNFNLMYTVLYLEPADTIKLSRAWLQQETNIINTYFRLLNTDIIQVPEPYRSLSTDVRVQFTMIGVRYVRSGNPAFPSFMSFFDPAQGGINAYNPQNTVNYYYAPYAWSTGVAVLPNPGVIGQSFHGAVTSLKAALNNLSNHYTAWVDIHELGHFLNLLHCFDGGCAETNCTTGGDRVCDTPPCTMLGAGCANLSSGCGTATANRHNHMDYSDRITCAKMFTAGQSTRARTAIVAYFGNHVNVTQNQPPTCKITLPSKDTTVVPSAPVTVNVVATDDKRVNVVEIHYQFVTNDGSDNQVEFTLENETMEVVVDSANYGSLFFRFTQPPYRLTFNAMSSGTIALHAQASDDDGAITETSVVRISVGTSNPPPVVSITSPVNGATYTAPASVAISATATDNTSISKVDFYTGTTLWNSDNTFPYSFTRTNVPAGSYVITARAYDSQNASTVSSPVSITVTTGTVKEPILEQYMESGKLKVRTAQNTYSFTPQ